VRTLLETEWAPPPSPRQPSPPPPQHSGPRQHPNLPPQTPPPWELPNQYTNWQQPPPPVHDRPGGGGEHRKTVLIVTIAVVLVVAAVLLGAFILRGKLRTASLDGPAGQASVTASPMVYSPPVMTAGCSDTTSPSSV
jgi:hypothetical protein